REGLVHGDDPPVGAEKDVAHVGAVEVLAQGFAQALDLGRSARHDLSNRSHRDGNPPRRGEPNWLHDLSSSRGRIYSRFLAGGWTGPGPAVILPPGRRAEGGRNPGGTPMTKVSAGVLAGIFLGLLYGLYNARGGAGAA